MRYKLKAFQEEAVGQLLKKMDSMQRIYEADGSLSAVALTAPTGAGKTVISAAVAEGLFYGNENYAGDEKATILWLSDSPSLNDQTMKRFDDATDLLNGATVMEAIGPDFAKSHRKLEAGHVYFLNRQLLGKGKRLSNEDEGGRSFYDVLNDTIEDTDIHLFLFIDEAHRGLGKSGSDKGTSDNRNKTIYSIIIDGQEGINKPMPCVVGISATPERFQKAMDGRLNRDVKAAVNVPVSFVKNSGLIKDVIELRTPKKAADTKHQDLTQACIKLAFVSKLWKKYCVSHVDTPMVTPLMIVQVEDRISNETLGEICLQIKKTLPWLDEDCFANVFGEHNDIIASGCSIPYVKPDEVEVHTEIKVLFAKDAVSTGWDCPRAEVIYSRRKRNDPTYIAQLIGRMIRTPLGRRIKDVEELNTVACYLPEYNAETVEAVVERLKEDNVPVEPGNVMKNPAEVRFFGDVKKSVEHRREQKQANQSDSKNILNTNKSVAYKETGDNFQINESEKCYSTSFDVNSLAGTEFAVNTEDEFTVNVDDIEETIEELDDILERLPKEDEEKIKECFEGLISRFVRRDKTNPFLDLRDCVDVIQQYLDENSNLKQEMEEEFYNNIESAILKYPNEYKRALNDIKSTNVLVKRVDPLTGEIFEDRDELVANDSVRLIAYFNDVKNVFSGASDEIKFYINKRMEDEMASEEQAICRISAVGRCLEIVHTMEEWASQKTNDLLEQYGPQRYEILDEEAKETWERIEGNTKSYVERNLNIHAAITRQNKDNKAYPKHIISDDNGWAYFKLNDLEEAILLKELDSSKTVAWYRNQPNNLQASLSIAYELNGEWINMYPDFLFFRKVGDSIKCAIVDPHGDWMGDSIARLRGYVLYLQEHPEMFSFVLVVTNEGNKCRYLDLKQKAVQEAIMSFTGNTAKTLFTGLLSKEYKITK